MEEALNGLLDAEADQLCGAKRYERSADRVDNRADSYDRKLQRKAGEVTLRVPRLRSLPFETQIIEAYRRRESSIEEALMEMYLAGVSFAGRRNTFWRSPFVVVVLFVAMSLMECTDSYSLQRLGAQRHYRWKTAPDLSH